MSMGSYPRRQRGESMKRLIQTGLCALLLLNIKSLSAQEEEIYEETLEPGLHVSADDSEESVLAKAARMGGSVVITASDEDEPAAVVTSSTPDLYTVKEGDTLWDVCDRFFGDPFVWPRIWSYNTNITNPNWIYPGDVLHLSKKATIDSASVPQAVPMESDEIPGMSPGSILVRSRGFIDKKGLDNSGTIVGSHKEVMWLSQYDEAYVEFPKANPKPGDTFSAFDILGGVDSIDDEGTEIGKLVEIKGLVKVTSFDKDTRIARIMVSEAIQPLPRGTLIGPVHRHFDVIPPVRNDKNLTGRLVAFLDPVTLAASHQIVFIDRGTKDGVKDGNRFFAVEQRDGLRRLNREPNDREGYPVEVIAEMRVIEARPSTSTCLITSAIRELEIGQEVEMRRGY
jgi:hypothetical protein